MIVDAFQYSLFSQSIALENVGLNTDVKSKYTSVSVLLKHQNDIHDTIVHFQKYQSQWYSQRLAVIANVLPIKLLGKQLWSLQSMTKNASNTFNFYCCCVRTS